MKKVITIAVCGVLLLGSCGTTTGDSALTGAMFGSIVGSAFGGIMGGPHGSDVGTLVGMATGAAVGAAAGEAAEREQEAAYKEHVAQRAAAREYRQSQSYSSQSSSSLSSQEESGYTQGSTYDDRLYDFANDSKKAGGTGSSSSGGGNNAGSRSSFTIVSGSSASSSACLEIINAHIVDESHDGSLAPNEQAKVVFEIRNSGKAPAYDVLPMVGETTGNKHVHISDNVHVECIQAGTTIRYAAMVLCDSRIRSGELCFTVGARYNGKDISSPQYFRVHVRR